MSGKNSDSDNTEENSYFKIDGGRQTDEIGDQTKMISQYDSVEQTQILNKLKNDTKAKIEEENESYLASKYEDKDKQPSGFQIFKESAFLGLPTSFTFSDFFICALALKFILIYLEPQGEGGGTTIVAATAFHGAYFSILMQSINNGILETQGISGTQAYSKKHFKKLNQTCRQAIYSCMICFILVTVVPCIWLDPVLKLIGVEGTQLEIVKDLIIYSFPAMAFRVVNDNIKVFIQNQDKLKEVGINNFSVFVFWLPGSFFIVKYVDDKALGYGLALLAYEVFCLAANMYIIIRKCDPRCRNNSLSAFKGMGRFFWYSIKVSMSSWLLYIFLDVMTVMLQKVGDEAQVAAYSIFYNITMVIFSLISGFYVYARNVMNYFLGKGRTMEAKNIFKRFYWIYLGFNTILIVVISGGLFGICITGSIEDKDLNYWLKVSSPFVFGIGLSILQTIFAAKGLMSIGTLTLQIYFQFFELLRLPSSYYLCITKGWGLLGILVMDLAFNVIKVFLFSFIVLVKADWSKAKSV